MTPGNLGQRGGNLVVDLLRRIEALERTVQQVPSRFLPLKTGTRFAKIAWRFTVIANESFGELVREDGTTLAEELVWIDSTPTPAEGVLLYGESVPAVGNDAIYEVALVQRAEDRASVIRDQYRVVRRVSGGTPPPAVKSAGGEEPSNWIGKLCLADGTVIQTTLAGTPTDNQALILDAFATTLVADEVIPLVGLLQQSTWLTERRLQQALGLPAGEEPDVDAPTDGQVLVLRNVDGRDRWVPEDQAGGGGSGVPAGADPLDFLRVDAAGTAVEGQPMGDLEYDLATDLIFTVDTNLSIGPDGGAGRIYVANNSMVAWIYEGNLALATEKHAEMSISAGKVNFKDNGTLVLEWSCHATDPTARKYDFKIPVTFSDNVLLKAAKKVTVETTGFIAFQYATGPEKLATMVAGSGKVEWKDDGTVVFEWTCNATAGLRKLSNKVKWAADADIEVASSAIIRAKESASKSCKLNGTGLFLQMDGDYAAATDDYASIERGADQVLFKNLTSLALVSPALTWKLGSSDFDQFEFDARVIQFNDVELCKDGTGIKFGMFGTAKVVQQTVPVCATATSSGDNPSGGDTVDLAVIQRMLNDIVAAIDSLRLLEQKLGTGTNGYGLIKH